MSHHDICLNIDSSTPDEVWDKIDAVYRSMEYWSEEKIGCCPSWKGENISLYASCEPGGIQIAGDMPDEIWNKWYPELKAKLTEALGNEIGEPEEGFAFKYWEPFVKSYADIKSIDEKQIVFNDLSTFYWSMFTKFERDITAKPPFFRFSSPLIELRITMECTGIFAKKKQHEAFHEFQSKLNDLGIHTLDLS